jgi:thymidine kinase
MSIKRGRIVVIMGPMFSGKTTELLRRLRIFTVAHKSTIVIKYTKDIRHGSSKFNRISTHDALSHPAISCGANELDSESMMTSMLSYDVIGIDEGQFFAQLANVSEKLASQGKVVIISGLNGTFTRTPFAPMAEIQAKAEEVHKLDAVCSKCLGSASFSRRLNPSQELEFIGGSESYEARCRECFDL